MSALGRIEPKGMIRRITAPSSLSNDRVDRVLVREGENVKAGQNLAYLSSKAKRQASLDLATQSVALSRSKLDNIKAGPSPNAIAAQEATVKSLEMQSKTTNRTLSQQIAQARSRAATARIEAERYELLFQQQVISELQRNQYRKSSETSQSHLNEVLAQRSGVQARMNAEITAARKRLAELKQVRPEDINQANQALLKVKADRERANQALNETIIRAPEDGQILQIFARAGERVGNKGILEMADTDNMMVTAEVYQTDLDLLKVGQGATVKASGFRDGSVRATLTKILPQVQRQSTFSSTPGENMDQRVFNVRLTLEPTPEQRQRLRMGSNMQVQVIFDARAPYSASKQ
ncbi:MAG: HlyD family efflux transporter periplasmic adaptor subunit [Prochlorococcus sp.]